MQDEHIRPAHGFEWTRLVLAVFEVAFFMSWKRSSQRRGDCGAELINAIQREEA